MLIVYIVFHDDTTEKMARQSFSMYGWARLIRIPSTKYCESHLFTMLDDLLDEWQNAAYVGIVTYSLPQKIGIKRLLKAVNQIISYQTTQDIVVLNSGERSLTSSHPGIKFPMTVLMSRIGHRVNLANVPCFWNNYWIARPYFMKAYIKFFNEVKFVMDTDPLLKVVLNQDSYYHYGKRSDIKNISKTFGVPYYTWHPFVCERLICIFTCLSGATASIIY